MNVIISSKENRSDYFIKFKYYLNRKYQEKITLLENTNLEITNFRKLQI